MDRAALTAYLTQGVAFYVDRLDPDVRVEAIRLRLVNIRQVAGWVHSGGGAVTGMTFQDAGPILKRGIWFGTLSGDVLVAALSDWVISAGGGDFWPLTDSQFRTRYVPVP